MDKPNNDRGNNKISARSERIILAKRDGDGHKTNILPFSLHILQDVTTKLCALPGLDLFMYLGFVSPCIFIHSNEVIPNRCSN